MDRGHEQVEQVGVWTTAQAATYDDDEAGMFEPEALDPMLDLLAELAAGQPVLEFASGTGRVALALADRGVDVCGIELSPAMVERMRTKPGSEGVPVSLGDMSTTRVDGSFGLVFLVFNTITNLLTQEAQVACFRNAADHLAPGGSFVVETFVPALQRLPVGERLVPFEVSPHHVGVDEYDVVGQTLVSHHVWLRPAGPTRSSQRFRYVWPSECDLMARLAGMSLAARWADWQRNPFTATSTSHVSVWRKDH